MEYEEHPGPGKRPGAQVWSSGDEPLLQAVRHGDSQAFARLYERHRGTVFAVARAHAPSREEAEDITSEAFTRAFALLKAGAGPRQFLRAYLVTAVSRLAVDRAREVDRMQPVAPAESGKLDRAQFFEDTMVRQVDAAVVARAFASLPERWQEVLWYLEIEGYRPRQVATVTGMRPNAVSALGKRARDGLRTAYMQEHVSAPALEQCGEYSSQLGAFVRGTLTAPRAERVREHLDSCPRCTAEYLQLQDLSLGLRAWVLPVLAGLPLWTDASKDLLAAFGAVGGSSAMATSGISSGMGGSAAAGGGTAAGATATSAGAGLSGAATAGGAGLSGAGAAATAASSGLVSSAPVAGLLAGTGAKVAAATVGVAVLGSGSFAAVTTTEPAQVPSGTTKDVVSTKGGGQRSGGKLGTASNGGPGTGHGTGPADIPAGLGEGPGEVLADSGEGPTERGEDRGEIRTEDGARTDHGTDKGRDRGDGSVTGPDGSAGSGTGRDEKPGGDSPAAAEPSVEPPAKGLTGGAGEPGAATPGAAQPPAPQGAGPSAPVPGGGFPPIGGTVEQPGAPPVPAPRPAPQAPVAPPEPAPGPAGPAPGAPAAPGAPVVPPEPQVSTVPEPPAPQVPPVVPAVPVEPEVSADPDVSAGPGMPAGPEPPAGSGVSVELQARLSPRAPVESEVQPGTADSVTPPPPPGWSWGDGVAHWLRWLSR